MEPRETKNTKFAVKETQAHSQCLSANIADNSIREWRLHHSRLYSVFAWIKREKSVEKIDVNALRGTLGERRLARRTSPTNSCDGIYRKDGTTRNLDLTKLDRFRLASTNDRSRLKVSHCLSLPYTRVVRFLFERLLRKLSMSTLSGLYLYVVLARNICFHF